MNAVRIKKTAIETKCVEPRTSIFPIVRAVDCLNTRFNERKKYIVASIQMKTNKVNEAKNQLTRM